MKIGDIVTVNVAPLGSKFEIVWLDYLKEAACGTRNFTIIGQRTAHDYGKGYVGDFALLIDDAGVNSWIIDETHRIANNIDPIYIGRNAWLCSPRFLTPAVIEPKQHCRICRRA